MTKVWEAKDDPEDTDESKIEMTVGQLWQSYVIKL